MPVKRNSESYKKLSIILESDFSVYLSLSDITPECLEARRWRRNEGVMGGDDGVSKSKPEKKNMDTVKEDSKKRFKILRYRFHLLFLCW